LVIALKESPSRIHIDEYDLKKGAIVGAFTTVALGLGLGFAVTGKILGCLAASLHSGMVMASPFTFMEVYGENFRLSKERDLFLPSAVEGLDAPVEELLSRVCDGVLPTAVI
jgi:hypothetical protein